VIRDALTIPNLLTIARAVAAVPIVAAILSNRFALALVLIVVAGFTDTIDGTVARRFGQETDLGRILDPIADKLLLVAIFVAASLPSYGFDPLPWWLAAMAIGRDVGIVVGAGAIYATTGFSGFTPSRLGKINTLFELLVVGWFVGTRAFELSEIPLTIIIYLTAASILVSGLHYVVHVRRLLAERSREAGARAS
jgi:cardiolipin synthase